MRALQHHRFTLTLLFVLVAASAPKPMHAQALGFGNGDSINTTLATDNGTDQAHHIISDGGTTYMALWFTDDTSTGLGSDHDIVCAVSTTAGSSWSGSAMVNSSAGSDAGVDRYPQGATDGSGTWIAVWTSTETLGATLGGDWDILYAVSTDAGASWSLSAPLNTNAATDSGTDFAPTLATDGAGTWIAVWYSEEDIASTGTDQDLFYSISTNDGGTWSAPTVLNSFATTDGRADWDPKIYYENGTWMVAWYGSNDLGGTVGTDNDLLFSRSTDSGASWSPTGTLNTNATTDSSNDYDPNLATDGAGNWVVAWESNNDLGSTIGADIDVLFARSSDDGVSWTAPAALDSNAASDLGSDRDPSVAFGDGQWVVLWGSSTNLGGAIGTDEDIFGSRSNDGGMTWTAGAVIDSNAATDSGFDREPIVVTDGSGDWFAMWVSNENVGGTIGTDADLLVSTSSNVPVELSAFEME